MMRVVCRLPVDPILHAGCRDEVDSETGKVVKTAKQAMMELAAQSPNLRPCPKKTGFLNGGWVEKKSCKRCMNCKKWWEE